MRVVLILGTCVICCGLIVGAAGSEGQKEGPAKGGQAAVGRTIEVSGVVKPVQRAEIYARITGELGDWKYDIGDRVRKDELLVEPNVPELELELRLKEALIVKAEASVVQAQENTKAKAAAVVKAKAYVNEASARAKEIEADQVRWKAESDRSAKLFAEGTYDRATFDQVLNQLKVADQSVLLAKAKFVAAQADQLEAAAMHGKAEADINSAKASVALAKIHFESANAILNFKYVRAPFDGVVLRRTATAGALAGPPTGNQAKPLFVLARTDIVRVEVDVPEFEALAVVEGARATVRFQALKGKEFAGFVDRMGGDIDPKTATRRVEIFLENRAYKLLPGMHANVVLELQAEEPKKKGAGADKPQPQKADAAAARLDAAKKAYGEAAEGLNQVKRVNGLNILLGKPEEVYTWSVRWLNAQRDMSDQKDKHIAALEEHAKRMKQLQVRVTQLVPELVSPIETAAAAWYLAEAELWLVKEKAKSK